MSEPTLLRCPFCGGEAKLYTLGVGFKGGIHTNCIEHIIVCEICRTQTDKFRSRLSAENTWNHRVTDHKYNELVEFIKTRVATQHIHAITDLCMANDAERLLRKHGVDV